MVIHVLAVVLWVGGVGMVTTVVIPIVRRLPSSANSVDMFEAIHKEVCVASQVHDSDSRWIRLLYARFYRWLEPVFRDPILVDPLDDVRLGVIHVRIFRRGAVFLRRLFAKYVQINPAKTFVFTQVLHLFMLILSLVAVGAAVANNHDWFPS